MEVEQQLDTWEGYVDWRNRPTFRGRHGGMLAASFVLVVEVMENLAYLANASNLVLYLSEHMHFSPSNSANSVTNFMGTAFLLALLGGFLSDSLFTTYYIYLISALVEFLNQRSRERILRLDIPVDTYPNFNFVGRLLGPRGNSLKRVEATTGCRVYIRGKGSIKDPDKEENLRGRTGYEHLNVPLHILIEADLPANVVDIRLRRAQEIIEELLKPVVDESQDYIKRQQLRELALLNSNFREESPGPSGSVSPFNTSGMKRAKTGR